MFFSKMRKDDAFGFIVFDNNARTLIPLMKKSEINEDHLFEIVKKQTAQGGNVFPAAF